MELTNFVGKKVRIRFIDQCIEGTLLKFDDKFYYIEAQALHEKNKICVIPFQHAYLEIQQ